MTRRLTWERDGRDWPNREFSRFINAAGMRWHVQVMGEGPAVLLIHGTGASTHSFRALAALLAPRFTVVMPDLPGHGFTDAPPSASGYSLPAVAHGSTALLQALGVAAGARGWAFRRRGGGDPDGAGWRDQPRRRWSA